MPGRKTKGAPCTNLKTKKSGFMAKSRKGKEFCRAAAQRKAKIGPYNLISHEEMVEFAGYLGIPVKRGQKINTKKTIWKKLLANKDFVESLNSDRNPDMHWKPRKRKPLGPAVKTTVGALLGN